MPRQYRPIEQYAEEILRLKSEGKTRAEKGARLGFSKEYTAQKSAPTRRHASS